jgi:hypothetical protein
MPMTLEGLRLRLDHDALIKADNQNNERQENENDDRDDDALISRHPRTPTTRIQLMLNGPLAQFHVIGMWSL